MAPLTADVSNLIAVSAVVCIVPIIAISVALMLMRQLRWFGFRGLDKVD